ncbi:flagellar export protein FliJ [Pleionea sp. CnH1-48]|uniref:flagellar export protein FliJ n=1 Tax=Pleionea sp. CnH1-48 TaxID=2954494 RepID=UPI002097E376|nr:flagellar export protein FliJ [Pleionea sp. CnH1-48]MCO7226122.1 flagellar export protein FliJ [Pleionea sp. CnH1-48]
MKPRSQRIEPVKRLAKQKEQGAADALGKANQSCQNAEHRLSELVRYRADYLAEFHFRAGKGMSGAQLQHYKHFLGQLDNAIEQQKHQLNKLQKEMAEKRKLWQKQNSRAEAVNRYQQKVRTAEIKESDIKESRAAEDTFNSSSRHNKS